MTIVMKRILEMLQRVNEFLLTLENQRKPSAKLFATTLHNVCAVQRGMFSTPADIMNTVGDIMSTLGVFSTLGGYHEYTGDIMINVGEGHWENN